MEDTQVLVVGAGPVGLTLAIDLGRRGVRCEIIEQKPEPAFLPKMERINARSMELYRRMGLAPRIRAAGLAPERSRFIVWSRSLAGEGLELPPIVPEPRAADPPLSFAQQRLWFLDRMEPGTPLYNIPAAIEVRGRLDVAALAASLNEIVRRHEVLRTTFELRGGQPMQVIHRTVPSLALAVADLREVPEGRRCDAHTDDVDLPEVLRRFTADLATRGVEVELPADPLRDPGFVELLREQYVRYPATAVAV